MRLPSEEGEKPKQKHHGVMYARSVSLAAAHLIGPDTNEVVKAYGSNEKGKREGEWTLGEAREEERKGLEVGVRGGEEREEE